MTEDEISNEARIYALEILTINLFAAAAVRSDPQDPLAALDNLSNRLILAGQIPVPGLDPALSDHLSSEIESALSRLAEMAKGQIRAVLGRSQS